MAARSSWWTIIVLTQAMSALTDWPMGMHRSVSVCS